MATALPCPTQCCMQIVWTAKSLKAAFGDTLQQDGKERFVSFSPPLHIANLVSTQHTSMHVSAAEGWMW